jgi:hypothetical protein
MGGVDRQLAGFQVAVYPVDPVGLTLSPPVVRPKTTIPGNYPDPFDQSAAGRTDWNEAVFTERVAVSIRGTYRPVLPVPLFLPSTIPLTVTATTGSEG